MSRVHIDHADIAKFATEKVNLPKDKADRYRAQVRGLRERLDRYLGDNPDFTLRKMLLSGSLAKGTALRTINDIDVGVYVSGDAAPQNLQDLLQYIADSLVTAYPNITSDQITRNTYSVTISFSGTGLDVDVVPILYFGDPEWRGNLISQDDGTFLETSIPLHLDFIRKRKMRIPNHYAQVIRLAKYWARRLKSEDTNFRFKSFMIELIMAKLADDGVDFSDYPDALQSFYSYILKSDLRELIIFSDYYDPKKVSGHTSDTVKIIDPVNATNNVGDRYTDSNVASIVSAAENAADAIEYALAATTKQETVSAWQDVFGSSFQG